MGIPVIIYGRPGSGKTRSLKEFAEDEILYCNVENKLPPFRKRFKYTLKTDDVKVIMPQMKKAAEKGINTAVIDDATYIMSNNFMRRHSIGKKGSSTFDLYNDIADDMWKLFEVIKNELPDKMIVYIILHEDRADDGTVNILTIGKLLNNKVMLEGIVTIALRCMSKDGRHFFKTTTDGFDITKAPEDMFAADELENDLKAVDTTIRTFYGL